MSFIKKNILETAVKTKRTEVAVQSTAKTVNSDKNTIDKITKKVVANLGFQENDIKSYKQSATKKTEYMSYIQGPVLDNDKIVYIYLKILSESNFSLRYLVYSRAFDTYMSFPKALNGLYMTKFDSDVRTKEKWGAIKQDISSAISEITRVLAYMKKFKTTEETAIQLVTKIGERFFDLTTVKPHDRNKKKDDFGEAIITVLQLAKGFYFTDVYSSLFAIFTEGSNNVNLSGSNWEKRDFTYASFSTCETRDRFVRDYIATIFFKHLMEDYYKTGGRPFKVSNFIGA
jgi:hypothetical protein